MTVIDLPIWLMLGIESNILKNAWLDLKKSYFLHLLWCSVPKPKYMFTFIGLSQQELGHSRTYVTFGSHFLNSELHLTPLAPIYKRVDVESNMLSMVALPTLKFRIPWFAVTQVAAPLNICNFLRKSLPFNGTATWFLCHRAYRTGSLPEYPQWAYRELTSTAGYNRFIVMGHRISKLSQTPLENVISLRLR